MTDEERSNSIYKYVRTALAAHPGTDASGLSVYASNLVPAKELRGCLAGAIVHIAREEIGKARRDSMDNALGDKPPSPKMQDRASWWSQMLSEMVSVNGEMKALGDCTFDDLQACIDDREQLINRISGQVENYKRLQKLMVQHRAKVVSDVPPRTDLEQAS